VVWFLGFTLFLLLLILTIQTIFHVEGEAPLLGCTWIIFIDVGVVNMIKFRDVEIISVIRKQNGNAAIIEIEQRVLPPTLNRE